ncbi:MAG: hypothetical protein ACYDAS_00040 [Patescibacteria group bacterium]
MERDPGFSQSEEDINEIRPVVSKWNWLKKHSAMGTMVLAATVGIAGCAANNESVPTPTPTTTSIPKNTPTPTCTPPSTIGVESISFKQVPFNLTFSPGPGEVMVSPLANDSGQNPNDHTLIFTPPKGNLGNEFNNFFELGGMKINQNVVIKKMEDNCVPVLISGYQIGASGVPGGARVELDILPPASAEPPEYPLTGVIVEFENKSNGKSFDFTITNTPVS